MVIAQRSICDDLFAYVRRWCLRQSPTSAGLSSPARPKHPTLPWLLSTITVHSDLQYYYYRPCTWTPESNHAHWRYNVDLRICIEIGSVHQIRRSGFRILTCFPSIKDVPGGNKVLLGPTSPTLKKPWAPEDPAARPEQSITPALDLYNSPRRLNKRSPLAIAELTVACSRLGTVGILRHLLTLTFFFRSGLNTWRTPDILIQMPSRPLAVR